MVITEADIVKAIGKPHKESRRIEGWTSIGCNSLTKKKFLVIQKAYKLKSSNQTLNFLIGICHKIGKD